LGSTDRATVKPISNYKIGELSMYGQYHMTVERKHELIKKYVVVKKPLRKKIKSFVNEHFKDNFVIGVHYRGTDKHNEAPCVEFETGLSAY